MISVLKTCRENQDASPKQKFASLNCFLTNHLSKVEMPILNDNLTFLIQKSCIRQIRNYKKKNKLSCFVQTNCEIKLNRKQSIVYFKVAFKGINSNFDRLQKLLDKHSTP